MTSTVITYEYTPEALAIIRRAESAPGRLVPALMASLLQGLTETENFIRIEYFAGSGHWRTPRGGKLPIGMRSRALRDDLVSRMDGDLSGLVGVREGRTSKYAARILGPGTTTVYPVSAKSLWIPAPGNLTNEGQAKFSPRDLMGRLDEKGNRLLKIVGKVALMPQNMTSWPKLQPGEKPQGVVMFYLVESSTIEGTDGLAKGVEHMLPRMGQLMNQGVIRAFGNSGGGGGA